MNSDIKRKTKEKYNRRKAAGICTYCGRSPVTHGKVVCEECMQKLKEYSKENYMFYKNKGFCVRCHREKAEPGKVMCRACLEEAKCRQRRRAAQKAKLLNLSL